MGFKNRALVAFLGFLATVALAAATYYVWQQTTHITVTEPLSVTSNLPTDASLPSGTYNYTINVTNNGGVDYKAVLTYTISTVNVTCTVNPASGYSVLVSAHQTVSIPVSVTVVLAQDSHSGTADINWAIQRVSA